MGTRFTFLSPLVDSRSSPGNKDLMRRVRVVKGDIIEQTDMDAIIASVPLNMDVSGSLNKALAAAAGEKLDHFIINNIYRPRIGDAIPVPGFGLPVKHIIFVIIPSWRTDFEREDRDLLRCYRQAMDMALRMRLKKIAFPALGTGEGKYPPKRAARLALQGIEERITDQFEEIRIVCNREEIASAFTGRLKSVLNL